MKLVDFDGMFDKKLSAFVKKNAGKFTAEQLEQFDALETYGYDFYFPQNADGTPLDFGVGNSYIAVIAPYSSVSFTQDSAQ